MKTLLRILNDFINYEENKDSAELLKDEKIVDFVKKLIPTEKTEVGLTVPSCFVDIVVKSGNTDLIDNLCNNNKLLKESFFIKYIKSETVEFRDFFTVHLRKALMIEISKINHDAKSKKWSDHNNLIKILGFEKIIDKNINWLENIVYKHKDYNIFWVVSPYINHKEESFINRSILYFNGIEKDINNLQSIPMSRYYQAGTDIIVANLDMRDMPSHQLTKVLSNYNIVDNLIAFNIQGFNKEDFKNIDSDLYNNMFKKNNVLKKDLKREDNNEYFKKIKSLFDSLSENEKECINIYGRFVDGLYSSNEYLSKDMIKKVLSYGFQKEDIPYVSSQIIVLLSELDLENPFNNIKASLSKLSKDEINQLKGKNKVKISEKILSNL